MTSTNSDQCTNCRGRGWKLLTLRRSLTSAGDAGERASLRRSCVEGLVCRGEGTPLPDPTVTAYPDEGRDDGRPDRTAVAAATDRLRDLAANLGHRGFSAR